MLDLKFSSGLGLGRAGLGLGLGLVVCGLDYNTEFSSFGIFREYFKSCRLLFNLFIVYISIGFVEKTLKYMTLDLKHHVF